jgi:hypothetical protein
MRFSVLAAATIVAALPAAPALAHCRTVHHRIHRVAWHAPVRHRAVRYAGCGCRTHVAYHRAVYPAYRHRRVVEVTYERPLYRPYPMVYEEPIYRPGPFFYGARFHGGHRYGFEHRGWQRFGFEHRHGGWGGRR